jgi:hypothetical protein
MEEQVALFEGINNLPDCQLSDAVQIPFDAGVVNEDDTKINLELAMLDIATQRNSSVMLPLLLTMMMR